MAGDARTRVHHSVRQQQERRRIRERQVARDELGARELLCGSRSRSKRVEVKVEAQPGGCKRGRVDGSDAGATAARPSMYVKRRERVATATGCLQRPLPQDDVPQGLSQCYQLCLSVSADD